MLEIDPIEPKIDLTPLTLFVAGIKQSTGGKRTTTRMILETILMTIIIMYNTKTYPSSTYMLMFSPVVFQVTSLYVIEKLFWHPVSLHKLQ